MGVISMPDLRTVRRLLIIRLSSIGDVAHALSVSAALGDAFPNLEISWVVEAMSADIVTGNPYLKEVIIAPRQNRKQKDIGSLAVWREQATFLAALRRRKFDVTLDLQGRAKSGIMVYATGARPASVGANCGKAPRSFRSGCRAARKVGIAWTGFQIRRGRLARTRRR